MQENQEAYSARGLTIGSIQLVTPTTPTATPTMATDVSMTTEPPTEAAGGLSTAEIAGIVICCLALILIVLWGIIMICWFCW